MRVRYSARHYRILYSFHGTNQIVLVHAFAKKTQQLRENDIALAEGEVKVDHSGRPVRVLINCGKVGQSYIGPSGI